MDVPVGTSGTYFGVSYAVLQANLRYRLGASPFLLIGGLGLAYRPAATDNLALAVMSPDGTAGDGVELPVARWFRIGARALAGYSVDFLSINYDYNDVDSHDGFRNYSICRPS